MYICIYIYICRKNNFYGGGGEGGGGCWVKMSKYRSSELVDDLKIWRIWILKANKTSKNGHSFYSTLSPKKSHSFSFYKPRFTKHCILYILLEHIQTNITRWCQKKHLHCTISRGPRTDFSKHSEIKCLYIRCIARCLGLFLWLWLTFF